MALGNNLSQVLISNTDDHHGTTGDFTDITYAAGAPEIGVWDVAGNDWVLAADKLFATTVAESDTGGTVAGTAIANPLWLWKELQFVQSVSGTPGIMASPIIHTSSIKRIEYTPYEAPVRQEVRATPPAITNGDDAEVKFVIRTHPTVYTSFEDPASGLIDLSGGNKVFPLGAFNTTNHKVITVDLPSVASVADLIDDLVVKVSEHKLLNDLVTLTDNTSTVDVEPRHAGVFVEVITHNITQETFGTSAQQTDYKPGSGEGWQVLEDEKRTRMKGGNFNRMYFPDSVTQYANTAYKYDKFTITYANPNWPNGAGIAPAGSHNQLVLYYTDSDGTAPTGSEGTFDTLFGITIGTAKSYTWY